jgi:hypothetical protein
MLRFQFGIASLSQQKNDFNGQINDFIGAAIRTHYGDDLRSKGYIYVAPLAADGPLKPNSSLVAENAWSKEICNRCLLKLTLSHEVAHIFGLPDTREYNLLGARFVEEITSKPFVTKLSPARAKTFVKEHEPMRLFEPLINETYVGCGFFNPIRQKEFWGIAQEFDCTKIVVGDEIIKIFAAPDEDSEFLSIGYLESAYRYTNGRDAVVVDFPHGQTVYDEPLPGDVQASRRLSVLATFEQSIAFSTFKGTSGIEKLVILQINPPGFTQHVNSYAFEDGEMKFNLINWDPILAID